MCRKLLIIAAVLLVSVWPAFAGIENTPHNLSSSGSDFFYTASNEDQICIFCHTPHGGTLDAPLWNRDLSSIAGKAYKQYDSVTLSTAISDTRTVNPQSLICLSCHDGSIVVGDIINPSGAVPDNTNAFLHKIVSGPGARIGENNGDAATDDLRDDHPISFSYTAVATDRPGTLQPFGTLAAKGLTLFDNGVDTETVECATCHDPHVDYIAGDTTLDPFLAMSNAGSAMCLACHIK